MLCEVNTGLDQIHECPLNCPLNDHILYVLIFWQTSHLGEVVSILIDLSQFLDYNFLIDHLHVAHAALRDGIILIGDERDVESYRERIKTEYDATSPDRERERREFIDRLARGDV